MRKSIVDKYRAMRRRRHPVPLLARVQFREAMHAIESALVNGRAILKDKRVTPCASFIEWAQWMHATDARCVGSSMIEGLHVSTIFLGIDHAFGFGPPKWFETMVFKGGEPIYSDRYETYEQAEAGHRDAVNWAKQQLRKGVYDAN